MLQNHVRTQYAIGTAGQISKAIHSYYLPNSAIVGAGGAIVGQFVKSKDASNVVYQANGVAFNATQEKILGVVIKDHLVSTLEDTNTYPPNSEIQYLIKGAILIETSIPASKGQFVCLSVSDGALSFESTKPTDKTQLIYTGFIVNSDTTTANLSETEIIEIISEA